MFGLFKSKPVDPVDYFSEEEKQIIVRAIGKAEQRTSGEIRIYIEGNCTAEDPVLRAKELFDSLNMHQTSTRNGVLFYLAMVDRKLAIFGDEGIHEKVGDTFWNEQVSKILALFKQDKYVTGIEEVIHAIGEALQTHFPYDEKTDSNELPDDIVFGK
ncbi:MAG: TPM domain-containing protein [Bacteroidota bacterium]